MKLSSVFITGYKSIGSKIEIKLNPKAAVLVGKSNVGKSNILKAINFAYNDAKLEVNDRCSWLNQNPEEIVARLRFHLNSDEIKELSSHDAKLRSIKAIILEKYGNGERKIVFDPHVEEKTREEPSDETIEILKVIRLRIRKQLRAWGSLMKSHPSLAESPVAIRFSDLDHWVNEEKELYPKESLKLQLKAIQHLTDELALIREYLDNKEYDVLNTKGVKMGLTYLRDYIQDNFGSITYNSVSEKVIQFEALVKMLPRLIFVENDVSFEVDDRIYFDKIGDNRPFFMNLLLKIGRANLENIVNGGGRQREDELTTVNNNLREYLSKYWNQENLRLELRYETDEAPRVGKDENIKIPRFLELDIIGAEGHRGSLEQQGPGFRWFLWFVVTHLYKVEDSDVLLLMDEPALHLHAAAQFDLLDRFEQSMERIQFLYTTHSPFLLNKNFPNRIVSVEKGEVNIAKRGTHVNLKPYHSQKGIAWEPIRSAIGLPAGASLYVGGKNLIVEGITDQLIISAVIQVKNILEQEVRFDLNQISINYGGDDANTIAMALFCQQEEMETKVLFDGDTYEKKVNLLKKGGFKEDNIFIISKEITKKGASFVDIEDLFPSEVLSHKSHRCLFSDIF